MVAALVDRGKLGNFQSRSVYAGNVRYDFSESQLSRMRAFLLGLFYMDMSVLVWMTELRCFFLV